MSILETEMQQIWNNVHIDVAPFYFFNLSTKSVKIKYVCVGKILEKSQTVHNITVISSKAMNIDLSASYHMYVYKTFLLENV